MFWEVFRPVRWAAIFGFNLHVWEALPTRVVLGWSRFVEREASVGIINLNHARLSEPPV